jgi:hypothetical protein
MNWGKVPSASHQEIVTVLAGREHVSLCGAPHPRLFRHDLHGPLLLLLCSTRPVSMQLLEP